MKIPLSIQASVIGALLLAVGGCKKEPEAVTPPETATQAAGEESRRVVSSAEAQTEVVKDAAKDATDAVKAETSAAGDKVQAVIDEARKLLGENKYTEALASLNSLSGQTLSTDQQSLVQSLKQQIQNAIQNAAKSEVGKEATKALNNLLPPK